MRHSIGCFRRLPALALLAALAAAGCGGGKAAAVRGKVTYRGTPLTMGTVVLVSEDGKTTAAGAIQPDGTYEVAKAPVGLVKAGVANPPPVGAPGGQALIGSPNDPETQQARALAGKYVPPRRSTPTRRRPACPSTSRRGAARTTST